ncbi:SMP-30/gluconolactonase/LRE family protein [soil metagenome]
MKLNIILAILAVVVAALVALAMAQSTLGTKTLEKKGAPMEMHGWEKVAEGLVFPEGPAWDYKDTLYFSNCHGGFITRVAPAGVDVFLRASDSPFTFGKTNGMCVGKDGCLYACDFGVGAIVRITPAGEGSIYVNEYEGKPLTKPNDLCFDAKGNLYFTEPNGYGKDKADGRLFLVRAGTKEVVLLRGDMHFCNGVAISADGKFLYMAESAKERVIRFPIQDDQLLGDFTEFCSMPGGDPDGMAFDVEGNLYVAHFGGGNIRVYTPDGKLKELIPTPGKKPSNVEFAGADMKTLYVTEDEFNQVHKRQMPIAGLKLFSTP